MAFIFGGNTGNSYEDMLRQRLQAQQLAAGMNDVSGPGGGINALARGLASGVLSRRADKAASEGREAAQQRAQSVLGTLFGQSLGGGMTSFVDPQAQQAPQDPQAPMVDQTDPAVSGAFAGKSDLSGLPPSLIQSESGGNWSALNSEGYGGRGQFGTDRLADAARAGVIPAGMTGADYSRQPGEVQQRVEQWHRGDVMKDLGQYVGTDVDGAGPIPPLTENSLLAVAHLGGKGGAKRFVESGGRYNPSDSNGTSLADYATRHAGGGAAMGGGMQDPMAGMDMSAVMAALSDPYLDDGSRSVIGMMLQQKLSQQAAIRDQQMRMQDPAYQMGLAKSALEIQQMQNPGPAKPVEVGGVLLDPTTGQVLFDSRQPKTPEGFTLNPGDVRFGPDGNVIAQVDPAAPPTPMTQEQRQQWGIPPTDQRPYAMTPQGPKVIGGEGVTINNNPSGGGDDKFYEQFGKNDADALTGTSESGMAAMRNVGRIDRLESLLASGPSGAEAGFKSMLGEYGINTDGLDTLQSAQALVNQLVPEQRAPGSGPMSDADLALFKQSLPRLINSPGGNALIIQTLRGINQYDAEGAVIVQRLRAGEIDRKQAFDALQARRNPLEGMGANAAKFGKPEAADSLSGTGWQDVGGGIKIRAK
ncbi:hypothetical protein [Paracoccus sp. PAR01]|uniref:hypothetical protein n=1 Tax=Paracoccus sp. PAR01 TaxID=2769282 RepID=UPI00177A852A|nr:hypothetical protein [Paracoccus sp. PAR01]MBD9528972.1 hypothetical protein [Paracoccus sp. PAR01]